MTRMIDSSSARTPRKRNRSGSRPGRPRVLGDCVGRIALILALWSVLSGTTADPVAVNPAHPEHYTVVRGDTLWDIAARFLDNPWQWPEIWHDNPEIQNPHYIYPGDVLVLRQSEGAPRLVVETPSELRLSPMVRNSPLEAAIPAIPIKAIAPFLTRPRVVSPEHLANAPYVVDFVREHVVAGPLDRVYVRSILAATERAFTIVRAGPEYRDFDSGEVLGQEGLFIADASLEQTGDPATVLVTRAEKEVRIGDRLLPFQPEALITAFQPHAPRTAIRGHILTVLDGVTQIGQYSVVSIDRGQDDGIEAGHVLAILQQGKSIRDTVNPVFGQTLIAPEQRAGLLMVFRTFRRISFALVVSAIRFIHIGDIVQTP